ncbi:MAG: 4-(cytidine 5'-diphospho)-2-C-methyl-D-erythritol kinase [Defluviitaleaceae bacterium]|nr:4-(cytidine 5'-diphospho)-2-C-methyl-D-erythritol kinase [Defluviitaleaceae bacterium]
MRHSSANANISKDTQNPRLVVAGGFVQIRSFAKINLFLDVIGKRADNYHNIESVMQELDFGDNISISIPIKKGFRGFSRDALISVFQPTQNVTLEVTGITEGFPLDEDNLIIKAVKTLLREHRITGNLHIKVEKNIPMGAGLGGGSSNCAATLLGVNEIFQLNTPMERLMELAKSLGADVPFCLMGGTALAEGIGEKLTPLTPHPPCYVVLAFPRIPVHTAETYKRLTELGDGSRRQEFIKAYETNNIDEISGAFYNIFTEITAARNLEIPKLISDLKNYGAISASMTGTGPTVFGYFRTQAEARAACDNIKAKTILTQIN